MKKRFCAALAVALILTLLAGCAAKADAMEDSLENKLDKVEDSLENKLDRVEETIENALKPGPEQVTIRPTDPVQLTEPVRVTAPAEAAVTLTAQEAETIALKNAGLTANQVTRLYTEYDVDHGVPEYDVEFRHGGWEYEYEIHATTGEVLFKEVERDD